MEIARALASTPTLLLLDEPTSGMNPGETEEVSRLILTIQERGLTILLIEHHVEVVVGLARKITVLNFGQKIGDGSPEEILNQQAVIEAYLGTVEPGME